ncbi:hypothetical protein B0H13DRAFT_2374019 [Mycena leptocephala]|nr:hypothetical protein B0H13DRAFT_2374019 [Mycena leptocephala]
MSCRRASFAVVPLAECASNYPPPIHACSPASSGKMPLRAATVARPRAPPRHATSSFFPDPWPAHAAPPRFELRSIRPAFPRPAPERTELRILIVPSLSPPRFAI